MSKTEISIVLSGLQGQSLQELQSAAAQFVRLSRPEGIVSHVMIALPEGTELPPAGKNGVCYCCVRDEKALYYDLPKQLDTDYITFFEPGWRCSGNLLVELEKTLERYPNRQLFVCELQGSGAETPYVLKNTFRKLREISVLNHATRLWVNPAGAFFARSLWEELAAPEAELHYYIPNLLLLQAEALAGTFTLISSAKVTLPDTLEDMPKGKLCYFDQICYFDLLTAFEHLFRWLENRSTFLPSYFQYAFFYFLSKAFQVNQGASNLHMLKGELLEQYYQCIAKLLSHVEDRIILSNACPGAKLNENIRYVLLRRKYDMEREKHAYCCSENDVALVFRGQTVFTASTVPLQVYMGELQGSRLRLSGVFAFPFDYDRFQIVAEFADKTYPAKVSNRFSYYKEFGEIIYDNYCYDITIPLALGKGDIRFYLVGDGVKVNLKLSFVKARSLLNDKTGYFAKGKFILYQRPRRIAVRKNTRERRWRKEWEVMRYLARNKEWEAFWLRLAYRLTRPFFAGKKIWIFFDKIYKGGDNAEYLYRYCRQQNDGIRKYYVLRKDAPDTKHFRAEGLPYVKLGSLKHRLLFLNSDIVFSTHSMSHSDNSFVQGFELYFRDLFRYKVICIQHGLTVQNIPNIQNRIVNNTKLYMLASPAEWKNLEEDVYDYKGRNILRKTGLARYDGLIDKKEKLILITPTWRNYLAMPAHPGEARGHYDCFKESAYFKLYNSLINNPRLLAAAKRYGYRIMYLLHPVTSSQKEDYGINEFVDIVASTDDFSYEDTMTRAALMVTDYSGVQFDFAYMYKPVVYYHPTALPPSYDEGAGYHMATDALGEIVSEEDELVDLLIQYMEEDCQMHPEYRKRVDDFFYYHDHNNCQRIYESVMQWLGKRR